MSPLSSTLRVIVLATAVLPAVVQAQDAVPTIDEIVAACRQRQDAIQSGKIEWKVERWMRKGAFEVPDGVVSKSTEPFPSDDLQITTVRTLQFSGEQVRYESFGPDRNPTTGAYEPFHLKTTWNGTKAHRFQDPQGFWNGTIGTEAWFQYLHTFDPLCWTYRMFDSNWTTIDIEEFIVRPELEDVGGHECVVLELSTAGRARPPDPLVQRLWLSRAHQFVVRRFEQGRAATVFRRIDIDYEDAPQGIPAPIHWTEVRGEMSNPRTIDTCDVTGYEFNIPVAADAFELTFPAGTWVEAEGEEPYMVRDDGSHRAITKAELKRGATYQDVIETPSGRAKLASLDENDSVTGFWVVQFLLLAVVLVFFYRARRAHTQKSHSPGHLRKG